MLLCWHPRHDFSSARRSDHGLRCAPAMITVVAPARPLAQLTGIIGARDLEMHIQPVLTDHTEITEGKSFEVFSPRTWKMADLHAKHEFLRAGFGCPQVRPGLVALFDIPV